jgi:alpha-glucosidase
MDRDMKRAMPKAAKHKPLILAGSIKLINNNDKMKKYLILAFVWLISMGAISAQTGHLVGNNVAVFYPANFDSSAHFPSFALLSEPAIVGDVPVNWQIKPRYYACGGKQCTSIELPENSDLYGTGEGVGPLRRNGLQITMWNTDNFKYTKDNGERLYQSHPWILGVRQNGTAFGILVDNTWKHTFKLNNPIEIISDGPAFRVFVIEKETPQEVVMALAKLTGTMEMPPLWALGFQQCRWSYMTGSRVREVAKTFRDKQIPCDVIWMDIDYMQNYKVFTFDSVAFANPSQLNSYLHSINFKSVWMIDPGVKKESGYFVYDQGTEGNHWVMDSTGKEYIGNVWPGPCAFPDYTRPETRAWWRTLYKDFMATGIDGVWNDMNEPAVFKGPDGTMPENNIHRGGGGLPQGPHLRYHNVYGYLMVKASREGIMDANPNKRPFVLSRANFLGGHRYAATWTGDNNSSWEHLKLSTPMSLNLGLSGQPFNGPDIGGFAGDADAELLAHWMAVGAFYPFSRNHSMKGTVDQEPWAFGREVEQASRLALERRYMLLPYLYTLFHEAATSGMPVMQPLFFADPSDLRLRDEQEAFMWGNDLIIVPKWAEIPDLPKGRWRTISVNGENSTTDKYQPDLLIREGAIVPVGKKIQSTAEYNTDSLTLFVSLDAKNQATGQLYHDAGEGFQYKNGGYLITKFTATPKGAKSLRVKCTDIEGKLQTNRTYKVILLTDKGEVCSEWVTGKDIYLKLPNYLRQIKKM